MAASYSINPWSPYSNGEVNIDPYTGRPILLFGGSESSPGRWIYSDVSYGESSPVQYVPYQDSPTTEPWEVSKGGDIRRIMAGAITGEPNYNRGAGETHDYAYQRRNPDGSWDWVDPGEHDEAGGYFWAGVNSQEYLDALARQQAGTATALDLARLGVPGAVGQALTRSEQSLTGGSNEDNLRQELAFYAAGTTPSGLESYYTPEMNAAIAQQITDSSPAAQASRDTDDGFGALVPLAVLVAAGIATGGFGLMGAGAGGLGTAEALAVTGLDLGTAGTMTAADLAAAETAAMSAWAAEPAVAASGINASSVLTNAAIGAGTSAVRGGDPLTGALTGAIGGVVSGSGIMGDVASALTPEGASQALSGAITSGVNAAATGAINTALQGGSFGDVLEAGITSGLTSGAGNYVRGELIADDSSGTVAGAAGGGAAGLVNSAITGNDLLTGALTGAAGGAASGAVADAGGGPATSAATGALVGGLVGSALTPDPVAPSQPATTTTTPPAADPGDLSWGDVTYEFVNAPRADMAWGTRLTGGA